MFRFLVNGNFHDFLIHDENARHLSLILDLNSEWRLTANIRETDSVNFAPGRLTIHRKTAGEDIAICGTLSTWRHSYDSTSIWRKNFSGLMESRSTYKDLGDLKLKYSDIYPSGRNLEHPDPPNLLHGVINIIPTGENCTIRFENDEYDKDVEIRSVLELNGFEGLLHLRKSCYPYVNLKCGSESIPALKDILSTRSPVFAAMFQNSMKEDPDNEVDVSDLEASVVRAMLIYLYKGKACILNPQLASKLLFAANKYQIQGLKKVCCDFFKGKISLQNVLGIIVLGDLYASELKTLALDYIFDECINFSVLEITEEWKTLKREKPTLAIAILTGVGRSLKRIAARNMPIQSP